MTLTFPDYMPSGRAPVANFIPFEAMTARQQAEHLVRAHGMGADYHGDLAELGLPSDGTDSDLITWHEGLSDSERAEIHADDEAVLDPGSCFAAAHTHTKEV